MHACEYDIFIVYTISSHLSPLHAAYTSSLNRCTTWSSGEAERLHHARLFADPAPDCAVGRSHGRSQTFMEDVMYARL